MIDFFATILVVGVTVAAVMYEVHRREVARYVPHRTRTSNAAGDTLEAFLPAIWEVGEWFRWWFVVNAEAKGHAVFRVRVRGEMRPFRVSAIRVHRASRKSKRHASGGDEEA